MQKKQYCTYWSCSMYGYFICLLWMTLYSIKGPYTIKNFAQACLSFLIQYSNWHKRLVTAEHFLVVQISYIGVFRQLEAKSIMWYILCSFSKEAGRGGGKGGREEGSIHITTVMIPKVVFLTFKIVPYYFIPQVYGRGKKKPNLFCFLS